MQCLRFENIAFRYWVVFYTLPQKKRNFNFQIFYGDPGPGSVTPGHVHQGKWNLAQSSLTYTPPQKKGNFRKVAFLLGKSVNGLLEPVVHNDMQ